MNSVSILFSLLLKERFFSGLDRLREHRSTRNDAHSPCDGQLGRFVNADGHPLLRCRNLLARPCGKANIQWLGWTAAMLAVPVLLAGCAGGVHAASSITGTSATSGTGGGTPSSPPATTPSLTSIAISPNPTPIAVGAKEQLVATATYSDDTTANVSATATWTSATESVATINASGLATAVGSGSTTVKASLSGFTATNVLTVSATAPAFPVAIPDGAASYSSLERDTGWSADASSAISPHPPAVYTISQTGSPVVMTLSTKGASGLYTGWMVRKSISTAGQLKMLIRASYTFSSVTGIQAWEVGRRSTNASGVTDNGQTQLVPVGGGLLEFDIVPSASGGWHDTGCRFPMFVADTTYNEELYYVDDASGSLSLQYVELNGKVCAIPSNLQYITGASLGWAGNDATVAFQPDANPSAVTYNAVVTMNVWMWN